MERLYALLQRTVGLDVTRGGQLDRVEQAVAGIAQSRGLTLARYLDLLVLSPQLELPALLNVLTNGFSWFYRDVGQMRRLERILATHPDTARPMDVWVAACSTGEDVYTTALIAASLKRPVRILGTDINTDSLRWAEGASYSGWSVRELPAALKGRLVETKGVHRVPAELRVSARFEHHNLMDTPPRPAGRPGWDLILCRNVLIYFTETAATEVRRLLASVLAPDGHLLLGAADSIQRPELAAVETPRPVRVTPLPVPSPSPAPVRAQPSPSPSPRPSAAPPDPQRVQLQAAVEALDAGDLPRAKAAFLALAKDAPTLGDAHLGAGIARHLAGETTEALESLELAATLAPELWPASYFLALTLGNLGRHEEARRAYQAVLQSGGRHAGSKRVSALLAKYARFKPEILALCSRRAR